MTMTIINDCDHYHRLPMPVYNDYDYDNYCFPYTSQYLGVHRWNPLLKYKKNLLKGNNIVQKLF